jgi:hypothetical protein
LSDLVQDAARVDDEEATQRNADVLDQHAYTTTQGRATGLDMRTKTEIGEASFSTACWHPTAAEWVDARYIISNSISIHNMYVWHVGDAP